MTDLRNMRPRPRPQVERWCLRPLLLIGALIGCVASPCLGPPTAVAGPFGRALSIAAFTPAVPVASRGAGEEFAVLIVLHLTAAEMNCAYRIEEGRLKRLLN